MADSQLVSYAKHARAMAAPGAHLPDCDSLKPIRTEWVANLTGLPPFTPPQCDGCVPDSERRLWLQIADEIDAYLAGELEEHVDDNPDQLSLMEAP